MSIAKKIKNAWQNIPAEVQIFLKRALLLLIVWKLVYHLLLFPGRIIDAPLTHWSSNGAEWVLKKIYPDIHFLVKEECNPNPLANNEISCMDYVYLNGKKLVGIADACNALELYILYIGFLICFPIYSIKKLAAYIAGGIIIIYITNILRLAALGYIGYHYNINLVDVAHHYIFKIVVYAVIFGLWVLYIKHNQKTDNAKKEE
jgi:Transmembrane exosortase (Exosortase_EpsH).